MSTIQFPGLWGLSFNISPVAFKIFGLSIYWYGIIISTGLLLAVYLGMKNSSKFGIKSEDIIDLVLFAVPISVICARLYYVIFSWDNYKDNLMEIFNTRNGGLAIYGGLIGALLTAWFFTRYKKIGFLNLVDFGMPYFVMAQGIGRWGNFVNQEAFGVNTTLPWGMTGSKIKTELENLQRLGFQVDSELPVHPTFLYESLWNFAVFFFLLWFRKNKKKADGEVLFLYMIFYGLGRFFIEGLRTDSLMLGNLRISQVLAMAFVVTFAILMYMARKKFNAPAVEGLEDGGSREYSGILKEIKEGEDKHEEEHSTPTENDSTESGGEGTDNSEDK